MTRGTALRVSLWDIIETREVGPIRMWDPMSYVLSILKPDDDLLEYQSDDDYYCYSGYYDGFEFCFQGTSKETARLTKFKVEPGYKCKLHPDRKPVFRLDSHGIYLGMPQKLFLKRTSGRYKIRIPSHSISSEYLFYAQLNEYFLICFERDDEKGSYFLTFMACDFERGLEL